MKRLLLLICTLLCANVIMAQSFWEGDLSYRVIGAGEVKVSSCSYSATSVNIPSSVTKTWTHEEWSYDDDDYITITDSVRTYSVTYIGSSAFSGCSSLTSVNIPNSVTSIGDNAFRYCSSLTSITIPNSVTSIGPGAFSSCSSLTSVTLSNNITELLGYYSYIYNGGYYGYGLFENCSSLTSITIPNSVTSIGPGAFYGCSSLTTLNYNAINCNDFDSYDHPFRNTPITTINIGNSVQRIPSCFAYNLDSLTSVTIPNSVTSIGGSAFYNCSSLTSVTIPNSVTSIESGTFSGCSSLTSVTIPNSVDTIRSSAFRNCSSLTSINIPNSVTSIGGGAFRNCSSLTSVTIHNSVTSIGDEAFSGCSSLTTLNYNAINCNDFDGAHPFSNTPITTINIGDNVQRIPGGFACNLDSLTSITIPNSVTSIGYGAFRDCSNLDSVTIGNSVTSIEGGTFSGCSSLTSITIPNSVTSIGYGAFGLCSSLTSITIPNSVTSIGDWAFEDCSSLTSVTIPNSVTDIGDAAFYGCSSLTTLNYNAINCNDFYDYDYFPFDNCPITTINIGDSVQRIPNYFAYNLDSLTSVTIGNSVDTIGEYAFDDCSSLTSVTIPNSVTSIGRRAFAYCSSLTSVTIGNSVTSIRGAAFDNCSSLTSVTIGNSVTSIGSSAFSRCSSLTSVTIPNSVDTIGNSAFSRCSSLTSVTIGNSVDTIVGYAFYNCSSLTSITCLADIPPALDNNVFNNTPSNKILYVNCGLKDDYISSWGDYFNSNNIQEITFDINTYVNNESGGSVAIERNNCSTATLTATANICYQFVSWNDGNTENPRVVYLSSDTSFTAIFDSILFDTNINATINAGETYTEFGFDVNEEGTYTRILITEDGCDSIVTLSLSIIPVFNTELSATICQGQTYTENGFNVSEAGVYTQILTASNGFDSIVTLSLNVLPIFNTELSATICQGQVYNENGFNVSEAGVYTQSLQTINGCDSIVTLTLNVNPVFNTELTATICQGQVYTENGFNVSEAGVYTQSLQTINGCDSIVTLTLNINPIFNTELSATICEGSVYNENGFNVSEAGTYTQTLQTINGCDSIVTLVVTTYPTFDTTITATINAGEMYSEFGFNESEAGTYVQNLQTVNGCDSTITLILDVNSSLIDVEHSELSFYPNPTDSKITFSSTIERIEVIDLTGRCVLTFSNAREINIESLPAGAYYLRLTNNDKAIMRKVIKE